VNLTLIRVRQNDQTKKISAWAAILISPTLIAGIYGMNFDYMHELHWIFGYPLALALMVSICIGLGGLSARGAPTHATSEDSPSRHSGECARKASQER
jgi:Mg2+ and Co2+ transporter CorA